MTAGNAAEWTTKSARIILPNIALWFFGIILVVQFVQISGEVESTTSAITSTPLTLKVGCIIGTVHSIPYTKILLKWAEDRLRSEGHIGDNVSFKFIIRKAGNQPIDGGIGAELYYKEGVNVILGPAMGPPTESLATFASYWELPMIAYFAGTANLTDKARYKTIIRLHPPVENMARALSQFLKYMNWTNVSSISASDAVSSPCSVVMDSVETVLQKYKITLLEANKKRVTAVANFTETIREILQDLKYSSRIIIACVDLSSSLTRQLMEQAEDLGMTNGSDYWFILPRNTRDSINATPTWQLMPSVKDTFNCSFAFEAAGNEVHAMQKLHDDIVNEGRGNYNLTDTTLDIGFGRTLSGNIFSAMYLYGRAYNVCVSRNGTESYKNGTVLRACAAGMQFKGKRKQVALRLSGQRIQPNSTATAIRHPINRIVEGDDVSMDANSSRLSSYNVMGFNSTGAYATLYRVRLPDSLNEFKADSIKKPAGDNSAGYYVVENDDPDWPNGHRPNGSIYYYNRPTLISPKQPDMDPAVVPAVACGIAIIVALVALLLYTWNRRSKRMRAENLFVWKLQRKDIVPVRSDPIYSLMAGSNARSTMDNKMPANASHGSIESGDSLCLATPAGADAMGGWFHIAMHGNKTVVLSRMRRNKPVEFTFHDIDLIKSIKELQHENLNQFIGVCIDDMPEIILVWNCAAKGSLKGILHNCDIELDYAFKSSIIRDIVRGLEFLHNRSPMGCHGFLRSFNCMVTNRWVVQLTDYGVSKLLTPLVINGAICQDLYSTAHGRVSFMTVENDIWQFGIILYEVICRADMPGDLSHAREALLTLEKSGHFLHAPNAKGDFNHEIIKLFSECMNRAAGHRPVINAVKTIIQRNSYAAKNLVDHMYNMMEKYANNLEALVNERTKLLEEQRQRADSLLYQLLPKSVADALKHGFNVQPETYEQASVCFTDVVGFTTICSDSSPIEVVNMLNSLYQRFDEIISLHDCYKVETIGDAYLIVSGVPKRNGGKHVTEIADMSLDIMHFIKQRFSVPHMPSKKFQMRIGIHSGPLAAGVIGLTMPRYCLFGDTVNVASRMESSSKSGNIQISWTTEALLKTKSNYKIVPRGEIQIKGKGSCFTYWLEGKSYCKPDNPNKIDSSKSQGHTRELLSTSTEETVFLDK